MSVAHRHKYRTFGVTVLWAFVGLFLITVIPIVSYTYYQNTKTILAVSESLLNQVKDVVIEKSINYLSPASQMAELTSRLTGNNAISYVNDHQFESYVLEIVKTYPQLAMFNAGDEAGNFLMLKKMPDQSIATKHIRHTPEGDRIVSWKYRDQNGKVTSTKELQDDDYDPRVRPWYIGAKSQRSTYWSDIYIFYTDKVPGITASYPLFDKNKNILGVFGLDIEVGRISEFLKKLKIGKNGIAFIINQKNELVAYPDVNLIVKKNGNQLRPARIDEIGISWISQGFREGRSKTKDNFVFDFDGINYIASITPFPTSFGKDWRIAIFVPENDFIGVAKATNQIVFYFSLLMIAIGVTISIIFSRQLSRPIVLLTKEAERIRNFDLEGRLDIDSHIHEIILLNNSMKSMKKGLQAFEKYVPKELVRQLIKTDKGVKLGGQSREITILFSDIVQFSSISENLSPQDTMIYLSEYLEELTKVILRTKGTVDKYIGDSIMAFWGAPLKNENHANYACCAAVEMVHRIEELNKKWTSQGRPEYRTRIGLHSGISVVGNIGSNQRMNYTALGDCVNLASRLEGLNTIYHTNIIVTEQTYENAKQNFIFRPLDKVTVKGRKISSNLFELIDKKDNPNADKKLELCSEFAKGLSLYWDKNWDEAQMVFKKILSSFPVDKPSQLYIDRCMKYKKNPPPLDWNGVYHVASKQI